MTNSSSVNETRERLMEERRREECTVYVHLTSDY